MTGEHVSTETDQIECQTGQGQKGSKCIGFALVEPFHVFFSVVTILLDAGEDVHRHCLSILMEYGGSIEEHNGQPHNIWRLNLSQSKLNDDHRYSYWNSNKLGADAVELLDGIFIYFHLVK